MPWTDLGLLDGPFIDVDIGHPRRRDRHDRPLAVPIRKPAVRDVRGLLAEGDTVQDRRPISGNHGHLLAGGIQLEGSVQPRIDDIPIGPNDQETTCRDGRQSRTVGWNLPFGQTKQVIRQVHSADVDRRIARVVQFDPIIKFTLRIDEAVGSRVRRQQLVNRNRDVFLGHYCRYRMAETGDREDRG